MYNSFMLETHPFGDFVPNNPKYLLLGSFTTKPAEGYEWFYANGRNQFWPIMEAVFDTKLDTKEKQQHLFIQLNMALADIILSCERKGTSSLDMNLSNITFNTQGLNDILSKKKLECIFFTSRFVEKLFKKQFKELIQKHPDISLITLPSPSPRYAQMSKAQKIEEYKSLLPKLSTE
jgi:hypoxanthine-DNA glycosylase